MCVSVHFHNSVQAQPRLLQKTYKGGLRSFLSYGLIFSFFFVFVFFVCFYFTVVVFDGLYLRARGFRVCRVPIFPPFSSRRGYFLRNPVQVRLGELLVRGLRTFPWLGLLSSIYTDTPFRLTKVKEFPRVERFAG
ncbi:hypothetical protein MATL_G00028600 [Megalops atlanticus]|uniref:Transmembrane protein n=1 Tax=Megalops atlanticus TaxID=7932 RepID=A0A9D3QEK1_MEGAT|nr:hypothetical protein MATL_G00028600 [Megalops atlanticus]